MREYDAPRLLLVSHIRSLSKELQQQDWETHESEFKSQNPRTTESGKVFGPTIEVLQAERKTWLKANPLDGYIPKALKELERISNLL